MLLPGGGGGGLLRDGGGGGGPPRPPPLLGGGGGPPLLDANVFGFGAENVLGFGALNFGFGAPKLGFDAAGALGGAPWRSPPDRGGGGAPPLKPLRWVVGRKGTFASA